MDQAQAPPAPGTVVLALEDVNKSFGAVAALRGAQLEVRATERGDGPEGLADVLQRDDDRAGGGCCGGWVHLIPSVL